MSESKVGLQPEDTVAFISVPELLARATVAKFTRSPRASLDPSIKLGRAFNHAAVNPDKVKKYIELTGDRPDADVLPLGFYFSEAFLGMATVLADPHYPLPMFGTVHRTNRLNVYQALPVDLKKIMQVGVYLRSFRQTDKDVELDFKSDFLVDSRIVAGMETAARFRNRPRVKSASTRADLDLLSQWKKVADLHIPEWHGLKYAWSLHDWNTQHISTALARLDGLDSKTLQGACSTGIALSHLRDHPACREGKGELVTEYLAPVKIPGTHQLYRREEGSRSEFAIFDPRMNRITVKGYVSP